jgi:tRNA-dependent cyclodipeptide synthase
MDHATTYPVIGMSPGNSYFKDEEVRYLLQKTIEKFGRTAILIADIPAVSTYLAFGYSETRARSKAVLKGNNLKNRTRKIQKELGYPDDLIKIIEWETDVMNDPTYEQIYSSVESLYRSNVDFTRALDQTTRGVIEGSQKSIPDLKAAVKVAVHYLLSELAFLEFAPKYLHSQNVVYVYHKNWPVYEDYIAGKFDGKPKLYLDFLLLENPSETFAPLQSSNGGDQKNSSALETIARSKVIRGAFANYPPSFIENDDGTFSGIFYELIQHIADDLGGSLELTEEVGYGVIVEGLNRGRFDIFCSTVWPTPERQQQAYFSVPLYQSDVYMWVRADEDKSKYEDLSSNRFFRIAVKENDISYSIANADFPNARQVRVPQLLDPIGLLEFVADDKADATFAEPYLVRLFNQKSSVKLAAIQKNSIRKYPNTFMFRKGEDEFKKILDQKIQEALASGMVKNLILKYAGSEEAFTISDEMYL